MPSQELTEQYIDTYMHKLNVHVYVHVYMHVYVYVYVHVMCMYKHRRKSQQSSIRIG